MLNFWHQRVLFLGQLALAVLRNQDREDKQTFLEEVECLEVSRDRDRWEDREEVQRVGAARAWAWAWEAQAWEARAG